MNSETSLLLSCGQYLDKFYLQATANPHSEKSLQIADQLAIQLHKLWQRNPKLVKAMLALVPAQLTAASCLALKQASLLLQYSEQATWPNWLTEQMLAAQIFSLCGAVSLLQNMISTVALNSEDQKNLLDPWSLCIRQHSTILRQHLFLGLFAGCSRATQRAAEWQSPAYSTVLQLCYQLALPTMPRHNQVTLGIEQIVPKLTQHPLSPQQRHVLAMLATKEHDLSKLGRFCSDQVGEVALITSTTPKLTGYLFDTESKKLTNKQVELVSSRYKLLSPRSCKDFAWFDVFMQEEAPAVSQPQAPLSLAVLNQLNPLSSISKQLKWFEQHPSLVDFILQVASEHNRQQLQVVDLRHALALLGSDQLPTIIRQAWLAAQIRECRQPHRAWFEQWQKTFKSALLVISEHSSRIDCKEPIAQLLALSFGLQLQQDEYCRYAPLNPAGRSSNSLKQRVQFLCWQSADFPRQVSHSLASTGLAVTWQDAALSIRHSPEQGMPYNQQQTGAMLCQFALLLTEQLFYGDTHVAGLLQTSWKNATHALDLTSNPIELWLQKLAAQANSYWPIYGVM